MEPNVMMPKEFKRRMEVQQMRSMFATTFVGDSAVYDLESTHIAMDNLMCEVLRSLGYDEGVDIFLNTEKWYA